MSRRGLSAVLFTWMISVCIFTNANAQVPAGFSPTPSFDEEFNESSLDTSVWTIRGAGTKRDYCYPDASAVQVVNGYARLSIYTGTNGNNYCGAISTSNGGTGGSFLQTYGYWEASIRFTRQDYAQNAFWLQSPTNGAIIGNPQKSGTEMDIFEHQFIGAAGEYDSNVYWDGYGINGKHTHEDNINTDVNDGNFHKFGLAWTPTTLTFYRDGVQIWQQNASQSPISAVPEYIIFDMELPFPPLLHAYGPLGSSWNAIMDIDYVRVYPYTGAAANP